MDLKEEKISQSSLSRELIEIIGSIDSEPISVISKILATEKFNKFYSTGENKDDNEGNTSDIEETKSSKSKVSQITRTQQFLEEMCSQVEEEAETDNFSTKKEFSEDDLPCHSTAISSRYSYDSEIHTIKNLKEKLSNLEDFNTIERLLSEMSLRSNASSEETTSATLLSKTQTSKLFDKYLIGSSKSDLDMSEFYKTQSLDEKLSDESTSNTSISSNEYYNTMNEIFGDFHEFVKIETPKFSTGAQIKQELEDLNIRIGNVIQLACDVKNDLMELMPEEEYTDQISDYDE